MDAVIPIRGVLFDKDGTLFDFAATWSDWAAAILADLAGGVPGRAEAMAAALRFDPAARAFFPDSPVIAGTAAEVTALLAPLVPERTPEALHRALEASAARAPLAPAVPLGPCLDGLARRGLALGVMTNDAEATARAHLGAAGVLDRFGFVAGFDSGHGAKPDPGPLLAFARAAGLAPAQVVMVGDSRHDLIAARAAGMCGLGVLTGLATAEDLAPLAAAVLPDIGHVAGWLDRRAA